MELKPVLRVSVRRWYEEWMQYASCAWIDPEVWFPDIGVNARSAKSICLKQCVVREQCLNYAMAFESGSGSWMRSGIYGGMSPKERREHEPQWLAEQIEEVA